MEPENCKTKLESESVYEQCTQGELLNGLPDTKKKKKGKKRKREESTESNEQSSKKYLKLECEKEINKSLSYIDSSYLDLRVKEEELSNSELESSKAKRKKKHKDKHETIKDNTLDESNFINTEIDNPEELPKINSKNVSRLSERLTFEDDDSLHVDRTLLTCDANFDLQSSVDIKNYQTQNKHLALTKIKDIFQSENEEEWILNCPPDININDFENSEMIMDGKNKIKIGGKTYNRTIERVDSLSEVTFRNKRAVLTHATAVEVHNYCKRIPKPHVPVEGVMINNQTNFIPLPDTKVRHPLFGADYKKAIKVRKTVQRVCPPDNLVVKKSKKNKHKKERMKVEEELEAHIDTGIEPEILPKKKKKRKREADETLKVSKKIKIEAGAWETERAIEKKLFNF